MDYFRILDLDKEPFSNSPDPDFFYHSRQHHDCLQKLELALRLRRGLNVVIGDVGTGKTTLCRQLIRKFTHNDEVETHLILDPSFTTPTEFLMTVTKIFRGYKPSDTTNDWQLKEIIKQYLFQQGVDRQITTVLIIDEGQKIPTFCLELLREFLNYETNEFKLLQIVIFAQNEFKKTVREYANFADRINLYHHLKPLGFYDTRLMIKYRLEKSGSSSKTYSFFTLPALVTIYWATGGYPRKVINLCHRCILTMIIQNRSIVNLYLVRACIPRVFPGRTNRMRKIYLGTGMVLTIIAAVFIGTKSDFDFRGLLKQLTVSNPRSSQGHSVLNTDLGDHRIDSRTTDANHAASADPESAKPVGQLQIPDTDPQTAFPDSHVDFKGNITPTATPSATRDGILGQITLERNETLSGLIQTVYGAYNSRHFKSLILANPHIDDPDVVNVGQMIQLPAIPTEVQPLAHKTWWILISKTDSVTHALQLFRSWPISAPPIRLVPYWRPKEGYQFLILIHRLFNQRDQALKYMQRLPTPFSSTSQIQSVWQPDAVFFADPYF